MLKTYTPSALAADILRSIETHPEAFWMGAWIKQYGLHNGGVLRADESPWECETTLCIAGWAVHHAGYTIKDSLAYEGARSVGHVIDVAQHLLGLGLDDATVLFYGVRTGPRTPSELLGNLAKGLTIFGEPEESTSALVKAA